MFWVMIGCVILNVTQAYIHVYLHTGNQWYYMLMAVVCGFAALMHYLKDSKLLK
jgi:L-asparagine transporter-like permease